MFTPMLGEDAVPSWRALFGGRWIETNRIRDIWHLFGDKLSNGPA